MRISLIFVIAALIVSESFGQAGTIDSTFGYKGVVTAGPGFRDNYGKYIIVMPSDDIWFSGPSWASVEYNSVGIPKNGPIYWGMPPLNVPRGSRAMAAQSDGKVLIGEWRYIILPEWRSVFDSSYGVNGQISRPYPVRQIVARFDGKIFSAGSTYKNDFWVMCHNEDGSVDSSFGINGIVTTDFGGDDVTNGLAIQPDGKIVVSGTTTQANRSNFVIARYLSDGSLDSSFGQEGKRNIVFPEGNSSIASIALHNDGRIVLAGNLNNVTRDLVLTTLLPNGETDLSFGNEGRVIVDIDQSDETCEEQSVLIDYTGKIVMVGNTAKTDMWVKQMLLMRFNTDGTFDETFAHGGKVQYLGWEAAAVAQQSTGQILVTGTTKGGMGYSVIFVVRINATGGPLPISLGGFTAERKEDGVLLSWKTASQESNVSFEVQRSTGGNAFTSIGRVFQKGNEITFSFMDRNPVTGKNLYRLKQLSQNNSAEYSNVLSVEFTSVPKIRLLPNPVFTSLQIEHLPEGKKTLSVVDYNGRRLLVTETSVSVFTLNVQRIAPGNYLLMVESEKGKVTIPFIKK